MVNMDSNRRIGIITGVIFIIATVAALTGAGVDPILAGPDYLTKIPANANRVAVFAFLYLVAAFTSVGIAITMYPVMKRANAGLAIGSVVFRTIEAVFYMVAVLSLLSLLVLSQKFTTAGTGDRASFQALGDVMLSLRDQATLLGVFAFCIGTFLYYYLFFQSRLIPRWLSGWGIIAIILMMTACTFSLFSGNAITSYIPLLIPILLQEMVLAVWLIVKGFNPST